MWIELSYLHFQVIDGVCMMTTFWPSDFFSSTVGVFIIFKQYFLPLFILVYCNGRIVWTLTRRIDSNLENSESNENIMSRKFLLARTNIIKSFLLVSIFFVICWTNEEIYYLMYNLGYDANWNSTYFKFCILMVFLNSTLNPFIYLFKYHDYQVALKCLFGCKAKGESEDNRSNSFSSAASANTSSTAQNK